MARDYDSQLLESTAVRRKRLREAVFFGPQRTRRRLDENIGKIIASLVVSAVICAGTVGWSFLQSQLKNQKEQQEQQAAGPNAATAPFPADWVGSEVTFPMLREELDQAHVPADLYVLPSDDRPAPDRASSYYLVTKEGDDGYSVGIVEFAQGRTGAEFRTEDEAARWLYLELVTGTADPRVLSDEEEQKASEQTSELVASVRERIDGQAGSPSRVTLEPGQMVDAYGQESGSLLFPDGTPFSERGLPASVRNDADAYHRYRVAYPFQAQASLAGGDGVRFRVTADGFAQPPQLPSLRWLVANGYLEPVAVTGHVPSDRPASPAPPPSPEASP
ncbi:TNT domain-containing protein, partial [Nocardiopsis rhodophaea]